jgi:hypothetical protein
MEFIFGSLCQALLAQDTTQRASDFRNARSDERFYSQAVLTLLWDQPNGYVIRRYGCESAPIFDGLLAGGGSGFRPAEYKLGTAER